jgi:hypothetical protein
MVLIEQKAAIAPKSGFDNHHMGSFLPETLQKGLTKGLFFL